MIVGAYVLHLYCDGPTHHELPATLARQQFEFSAPTQTDARRAAKREGWTFKAGNRVFCRRCANPMT